jgi:hypothetical protein
MAGKNTSAQVSAEIEKLQHRIDLLETERIALEQKELKAKYAGKMSLAVLDVAGDNWGVVLAEHDKTNLKGIRSLLSHCPAWAIPLIHEASA